MSDIPAPDQPQKSTETIIQRILNSNILTTTLTCSILMVIFSVCYRPNGGDFDPSFTFQKKFADLESRLDNIEKLDLQRDMKLKAVKEHGGGDFDPSFTIQKKLADFESRLDNIEKLDLQRDFKLKEVAEQLTSKIKDVQKKEIFFNAKMTANTVVTGGHTVIFDKVVENTEDSYNGLTGIFRAPVSGMYLFSLSVLSLPKKVFVHTQLVKNGIEIGRIFTDAADSWGQMGTVTVVTRLEKGDEVYAKQMPELTGNMQGNFYCSFSGVLI